MAGVCLYTYGSCGKACGGNKWHWGSQQTSWLWDPGIQKVEVGVLAEINRSRCGHVQSTHLKHR